MPQFHDFFNGYIGNLVYSCSSHIISIPAIINFIISLNCLYLNHRLRIKGCVVVVVHALNAAGQIPTLSW